MLHLTPAVAVYMEPPTFLIYYLAALEELARIGVMVLEVTAATVEELFLSALQLSA